MQQRRRFSLRTRVSLLAACCVAAAVALASGGAYVTMHNNLYQQIDDSLVQRAQSAVHTPPVRQGLQQFPAALLSTTDLDIGLLDVDGGMVSPKGRQPSYGAAELAVAAGQATLSLRTDGRTDSRVVAMPVRPGEAIVFAQSLRPTQAMLSRLALVLFLIGCAGVILAALAGTAVARGGLAPVERLTVATERVARTGDLRPIPVTGDDELARLTGSFNAMLGAVADAQERQRQLVADAGHELRTPLTSMRTNLELLLASEKPDAPKLPESERVAIEADIRAQLDELTQLIGDLQVLSRGESPTAEVVDLAEIVEHALDRARRRAGEVSFDVSLQSWRIVGEASELERAVMNLLDNALKFAPPASTVTVRSYAVDEDAGAGRPGGNGGRKFVAVDVGDAGPGIAEQDMPRIFDRFYRSLHARTLPGSGLGLAIVKQAAERHGGHVRVGRSEQGGALFSLRLPLAPADNLEASS